MLTSYSRVTVVSGTRRVDLALPSALPVADVVPQVLRFCAPDDDPGNPAEFTLAKLGGQPLSLLQTLAEAGVHDGDVIELRAYGAATRPAFVEDVRDSIEDSVDDVGGAWTTRSTVSLIIGATSGALFLLLLPTLVQAVVAVLGNASAAPWGNQRSASGLVAAALLLAVSWAATRWANRWVSVLSSAVAGLWAFTAAGELVLRAGGSMPTAMTVGAGAAAVVAGALRLVTPRAMPLVATTAVLLVAAAIVDVATAIGADPANAARVVALLAVLVTGVLPRVSIAVGGLSSADYRVRNAGRMSDQALAARLQDSRGLLIGTLYGVSIVVAGVGFWLALRPQAWGHDLWDGLLSASLAAALLLRSRVFSRTVAMLPLRLAALTVLLGIVLRLALDYPTLSTWLAAAVAGAGVLATGVSILLLSDVTRARIKRALNMVEFIVVVDLVVVTMGAVTLYDWLGDR